MSHFIQKIKHWYYRNYEQKNKRIKGYLIDGNKSVLIELEYIKNIDKLMFHYLKPMEFSFSEPGRIKFKAKNMMEVFILKIAWYEAYGPPPRFMYD